ncbi:MAG: RluA family pseudouridine synthase [Lactovum sp.]
MQVIIDEKNVGLRLDKALSNMTNLSRSLLTELIREDKVRVNTEIKKAKYKVKLADQIDFEIPKTEVLDILAEELPLDIVYEDEDIAIINKAQGMVVHPSVGHDSGTLVNALMYHIKDLSGINGCIRPGIVHRIDKDTSGLLMIAKNDKAHESLAGQLKAKTNKRRYLAIVHGDIKNDKGLIEAPTGRDPKNRQRQAVIADGKAARTHFEVLERYGNYSFVSLELETGRTHQIRVHMAYIGHPLAADSLYGPTKTLTPNKGQFLHAEMLGLIHPRTGEYLEFQVDLPSVFQEQLNKLRKS